MKIPFWLYRLLPMWDYVCPKCRREVKHKSHKCPYCGENYGVPLRVPPKVLKDPKALENYVHQKIFPKISAEQREYLAQYFTILFAHGFEGGDFGNDPETGYAWTGTVGTPTVVTDPAHHGTYAMQTTASGKYAYVSFSDQTTVFVRLYFRMNTVPIDTGVIDPVALYSGTTYICFVRVYPTLLRLRRFYPSAVNFDYTKSWAIETWYCIELKFVKASGTSGEYRVYLDGVEVITNTSIDTSGAPNPNTIRAGNNLGAGTYTSQVDCVIVADAYIGVEPSGQTYEISVDATVKSLSEHLEQTVFNVEKDTSVYSQAIQTPETTFNISKDAIMQALASVIVSGVIIVNFTEYGDIMINAYMDEYGSVKINGVLEDGTRIIIITGGQVYEIYVDATAQALASHSEQTTFNIERDANVISQITTLNFELDIPKDAIINALTDSAVQSFFNLSPDAVVRVLAEVSVVKEGEVKVTKLFLILGNLAIQIQDN